ncbi:MAG TPA: rod shape-determining protein RodA [Solirubrobacteraceae bacterium]|nr:rod shape-determining protein RodA [Solirubrobacteraceae bacterium]
MSPSTATSISPSGAIGAREDLRERRTGRSLRLPLDPALTFAVLGLGACSLVTLGVATRNIVPGQPDYYVNRQATYLVVGVVCMLALSRLDYGRLRQFKNAIYGLLIFSVLAVFALGHAANGAQRAISLPFFSFQASELGKVLLTLALAALIVDRARALRERETTARVLMAALVPAMLVVAQPDLGSGMVYMVIAFTMLLVAGTPWRQLAAIAALVIVSITLVLGVAPLGGVHLLKPYQEERLTAFLHPSNDPQKAGYQQQESKIAIGSGQKTGGGHGAPYIRLNFVPEADTDFVFAAVGEQYGFVGAALVLGLYALLISRALRILVMAKDLFGSLVAAGVAAMLMFQVFVNVGMTIGIMPITGITLPLMSYGGSSVITTLLAAGLLQSIYARARASAALKGRVPLY